jgi:cation:H+ antiporter
VLPNKLIIKYLTIIGVTISKEGAKAGSAIWTFPAVIISAMLIAWAAEAAQFLISQGLALAILAWLQTLPEFAVEGVIAWTGGKDPEKIHLATANLTGAIRLLPGLGWPLIFLTAFIFNKIKNKRNLKEIVLEKEHSVEVLALLPPLIYFGVIFLKGTFSIIDSLVLILLYSAYLYCLNKVPPQEAEEIDELEPIPRNILRLKPLFRNSVIAGLFLAGGLILLFVAKPFLQSMLGLALTLGVSEFVFVQWVAPFLSEFPEKVSAFYWARQVKKAPIALMNMVSSNINEWTMLAAVIPIVFSISSGGFSTIHFDQLQLTEILLTMVQSLLAFLLLLNMRFSWYEALGLFLLWAIQLARPGLREEMVFVYVACIVFCLIQVLLGWRQPRAFTDFFGILRNHILVSRPSPHGVNPEKRE